MSGTPTNNRNAPSRLENLAPEIFNLILGELLGSGVSCPAILRLNKALYRLAKSYLDNENDWILFDVDFGEQAEWMRAIVPIKIVKDPETQALPPTVLTASIRAMHNAIKLASVTPPTTQKAMLLVCTANLQHFLRCVLTLDLALCQGFDDGQYLPPLGLTVRKGFHGLRIVTHVHPMYADSMRLLESFTIFKASVHELCIVGAPDGLEARQIEQATTVRRHPFRPEGDEPTIQTIWLLHWLDKVPRTSEYWRQVCRIYKLANILRKERYLHTWFYYSYGWSPTIIMDNYEVPLLLEVSVLVNGVISNIKSMPVGSPPRPHFQEYRMKIWRKVLANLSGSIGLMFAMNHYFLYQIFMLTFTKKTFSKVDMNKCRLEASTYEWLVNHAFQSPNMNMRYPGPPLIKASLMMAKMLKILLDDHNDSRDYSPQAVVDLVRDFHRWFRAHLKLFKWRIHEDVVSEKLRPSAEAYLLNHNKMTDEEMSRYQICDGERNYEGRDGTFYLL